MIQLLSTSDYKYYQVVMRKLCSSLKGVTKYFSTPKLTRQQVQKHPHQCGMLHCGSTGTKAIYRATAAF